MSGKDEYKDIFERPHHVSSKHPQMSRLNRATQFSPFAALTGYGESIEEAARVTDDQLELARMILLSSMNACGIFTTI